MKLFLFLATISLLAPGRARGENSLAPPVWPEPDVKSTEARIQPVAGLNLDAFRLTLEENTFDDVLAALGGAPIRHSGDAGDALTWVCYTLPSAYARIWFTSSELGGGKYIDGLVVTQLGSQEGSSSSCPVPSRRIAAISMDHGIWLGDSVKKMEAALGPASKSASVIRYEYVGKDGEFDVDSVLEIKSHKGKITELYVSHTTTD